MSNVIMKEIVPDIEIIEQLMISLEDSLKIAELIKDPIKREVIEVFINNLLVHCYGKTIEGENDE